MAISLGQAIPTLRMFDEAKAREFYVEFLGCKIDFEHRFEPTAPLFMQVSRDGMVLRLSEHHGDGNPGMHLAVLMQGVDALHAELTARNYKYGRPGVEDQFWGARTLTVHDPFGNQIMFSESRD